MNNREERIKVLHNKFNYTGPIEFDENNKVVISDDFYGDSNKLKSLIGGPEVVRGGFYCCYNQLTSLEGSPMTVGGEFICYSNKLTSLKGAPNMIGGSFDCSKNKLTSLDGIPKKINGEFSISIYPDTPLLKILDVIGITIFNFYIKHTYNHIYVLEDLFKKYYGTKNAIMKVGLEMIRLGYGSNARL